MKADQYSLIEKIKSRKKISRKDGLILCDCHDLSLRDLMANMIRCRWQSHLCIMYVMSMNSCLHSPLRFFASYYFSGSDKIYVLSREKLAEKIVETKALGEI